MAENSSIIQSVDRAILILDLVGQAGEAGLSLKELSQKMKLNASTVHHLLGTLVQRRVIEQDQDSKRYRLGLHLIELGNSALRATSLARIAQPFLTKIWDATGHTVSIIVFHGLLRTPLAAMRSRQMLTAAAAPLEVSTLHATGSGKLLLAYLNEQELDHYFQYVRLERFTTTTITSADRLREALTRIRETGAAVDDEEYGSGVRCISVPIHDSTHRVAGCFDVVFPGYDTNDEDIARIVVTIKQVAQLLSNQLHEIGLTVN